MYVCLTQTQTKLEQMLQQEAYLAIWHPVDAQNSAITGTIPPNSRKPVWDQAKPPCKISRRLVKPRPRNPSPCIQQN